MTIKKIIIIATGVTLLTSIFATFSETVLASDKKPIIEKYNLRNNQ